MRGWASIVSVGFDDFCRFCAVRRSGRPRRQTSRPPDTSVSGVSHGPAPTGPCSSPFRPSQSPVPSASVPPPNRGITAEPWCHRRTVASPPNRGVTAGPWYLRRTVVSPPNRGVTAEPWCPRRTVVSPPDRGVTAPAAASRATSTPVTLPFSSSPPPSIFPPHTPSPYG